MKGVSVIMPTLNEAGHIRELITEIAHYTRTAGVECVEILVVDDDSPDGTWRVAQETQLSDAQVRVIRRLEDHGLTNSLRAGIAAAAHDTIVWMDCDFSHPPSRIPQMLYMVDEGFDAVVNSRYVIGGGENRIGKGGPMQMALSALLNWSVRFMLRPSFSDYTSGFIAVRREVLDEFPLRGDYGEYFLDFIYRVLRSKRRVCELPFTCEPRRSGESKTGSNLVQYLRRGRKYIAAVARVRYEHFGKR